MPPCMDLEYLFHFPSTYIVWFILHSDKISSRTIYRVEISTGILNLSFVFNFHKFHVRDFFFLMFRDFFNTIYLILYEAIYKRWNLRILTTFAFSYFLSTITFQARNLKKKLHLYKVVLTSFLIFVESLFTRFYNITKIRVLTVSPP